MTRTLSFWVGASVVAAVLAVTPLAFNWPFQATVPPCERFPVRAENSMILGCLHLSAVMRLGEAGKESAPKFWVTAGDFVKQRECRAFDVDEPLMACRGEGPLAAFLEIYPEREPGQRFLSPAEMFCQGRERCHPSGGSPPPKMALNLLHQRDRAGAEHVRQPRFALQSRHGGG